MAAAMAQGYMEMEMETWGVYAFSISCRSGVALVWRVSVNLTKTLSLQQDN